MSRRILNKSVLVLNRFFMAVQVTIVRDAITALTTGKAEVVDDNYQRFDWDMWKLQSKEIPAADHYKYEGVIRSPSTMILAPQVIRFPDCDYTSPLIKTVRYSRRNIYDRDDNTCQYCGKKFERKALTLDHVVPKSRGGKSSWTNVVACCTMCNADKGNRLLEEIGWKLKKQPVKPRWTAHVATPFRQAKKDYWEKFLG